MAVGLVLDHGRQLANTGELGNPDDIVHLRLDEVGQRGLSQQRLRARRSAYRRNLSEPIPESSRRSRANPGQALPQATAIRLGAGNGAAGRRTGERTWRGIAAASGSGHGPMRVVRRQAHIGKVRPGDVALVPDPGPAWGWLALAGVPLIIERGGPLGHAPTIARECGSCCVIAGPGLAGLVSEGEMIKVSGETGEVTW